MQGFHRGKYKDDLGCCNLMMEAVCTSEISVNLYKSTSCNAPEDIHLRIVLFLYVHGKWRELYKVPQSPFFHSPTVLRTKISNEVRSDVVFILQLFAYILKKISLLFQKNSAHMENENITLMNKYVLKYHKVTKSVNISLYLDSINDCLYLSF
jgi:hypothetical protein